MSIMVTGGAGYIGSHAVQRLLRVGARVVVIDDLSRGHRAAIDALARDAGGRLVFEAAGIDDGARIERLMLDHAVGTVLHFAALAYVGESVTEPLRYYRTNVAGSLALLEACERARVSRFVFSSSCATYGEPGEARVPVREDCPQDPVSPYGRTKLDFERILSAWAGARAAAGDPVSVTMLRYFNVAGADRTGVLGEDHDPETHLVPVAINAALGRRDGVAVFGTDYPTPDGSCVRDFVHVEDLVDAHVLAMDAMTPGIPSAYNIGSGTGYSVLEVLDATRRVTGVDFPVRTGPRRPGDPARLYADPGKIRAGLGWSPSVTDLDEVVDSAYQWLRAHPGGYGG